MRVSCKKCPANYTISDDKVRGRRVKIKCKRCGSPIIVEGTSLAPSAGQDPAPTSSTLGGSSAAGSAPPVSFEQEGGAPPVRAQGVEHASQVQAPRGEAPRPPDRKPLPPRPQIADVPRSSKKEISALDELAGSLDQRVAGPPSYAPALAADTAATAQRSPQAPAPSGETQSENHAEPETPVAGPVVALEARPPLDPREPSYDDETVAVSRRELLAAADASESSRVRTPLPGAATSPLTQAQAKSDPLTRSAGDALRGASLTTPPPSANPPSAKPPSEATPSLTPAQVPARVNPTPASLSPRQHSAAGAGWWLTLLVVSAAGLLAGALATEAGRNRISALGSDPATAAPPFDTSALSRAWVQGELNASRCLRPSDSALSGRVSVRFAETGEAKEVTASGSLAGSEQLECVQQALRAIRVPAFSGPAAVVKKTLELRAP